MNAIVIAAKIVVVLVTFTSEVVLVAPSFVCSTSAIASPSSLVCIDPSRQLLFSMRASGELISALNFP